MDTIDQIIVENILARTEKLGWNQRELATKANMDPVQLNRILRFKKKAGATSIAKIAEALGCTPLDLQQRYTSPDPIDPKVLDAIREAVREGSVNYVEITARMLKEIEELRARSLPANLSETKRDLIRAIIEMEETRALVFLKTIRSPGFDHAKNSSAVRRKG